VYGAVQESKFIFVKNGFDFCKADPINIFEAGFGTGLNALLTAVRCLKGKREVFYTSIEKYPLADEIITLLNYPLFTGKEAQNIFKCIHESGWNKMQNICVNFNLRKIKGDITSYHLTGCYDLIYFDAFSPDKQPEMWSSNVFTKISGITAENGIFITYSVKGDVKRNLKSCGFDVHILPGPPGKRHILRAIKK
jgi:tRNA U34 5-methylaminomethyl-2-thiouridine-forming methyltransferase MnmC